MIDNIQRLAWVMAISWILAVMSPVFAAPEETRPITEDSNGQSPPSPRAGPFKEPIVDRSVETRAIQAVARGETFSDPPNSSAIAQAIARLRSQPTPAGEVFALVAVTDRLTGERRLFTRGMPSKEIVGYIQTPSSAPAGQAYEEGDEAIADENLEIVTRFIRSRQVKVPRAISRDEEEENALRIRNQGGELSFRIEEGLRRRIASGEISLKSRETLPVTTRLKNIPRLHLPKIHDVVADGLLWVGLDISSERQRAIIDRKKKIKSMQKELRNFIESKGGKITYASWTGGALAAQVPANILGALAKRKDVFSIEYREVGQEESPANKIQGDDIFEASDAKSLEPFHMGAHGLSSKHSFASQIVIAQSDACIDQSNPAWLDSATGASRGNFYNCDNQPNCTAGNLVDCAFPAPSGSSVHATRVATQMVANFMDGQDAAVSVADRRIMTGTCPKCAWVFLQDQGLNDIEKAMDKACELGVDIWEQSFGDGVSCDGNGGYDDSVEALADCDVVMVKGAANDGSSGAACNTHYPADHPWTFTVGGMGTISPCNSAAAYYTSDCQYSSSASQGGGNYEGGGTATIIDITAPYNLGNTIVPDSRNPVTYDEANGTSLATPVVAGLMARLMDWYQVHISDALFFSNRARNFMLLMGDRSANADGIGRWINNHDVRWGAGRVGLVPFDEKNTWAIYRSSLTLQPDDTWTFTMTVPHVATFLKAVVWHDGYDYSLEPMIGLTLDPVDCATATKSVNRHDSKAMLVYNSTPLSGCTQISVTVENIKQGSGERRFHFAAYTDTEDERHY